MKKKLKYFNDYKVNEDKGVRVAEAKSYTMWFKPGGWAIFTINDTTGEFHISSDWGAYSHSWHIPNTGCKTLTEFLAKTGPSYIVNKLSVGDKNLDDFLDVDETLESFRNAICKLRRERELDAEQAREAWHVLDEWHDAEYNFHVCPSEIWKIFQDPIVIGDLIVRDKPFEYVLLRDTLIPAFQKYLNETVLVKEKDKVMAATCHINVD